MATQVEMNEAVAEMTDEQVLAFGRVLRWQHCPTSIVVDPEGLVPMRTTAVRAVCEQRGLVSPV